MAARRKEMTERLKMPSSSSWQVVSQDLSVAVRDFHESFLNKLHGSCHGIRVDLYARKQIISKTGRVAPIVTKRSPRPAQMAARHQLETLLRNTTGQERSPE
jgi:hypothetical protein